MRCIVAIWVARKSLVPGLCAHQRTAATLVTSEPNQQQGEITGCDHAPHPQDPENHLARTRHERLLLLLLALADRAQVALREDRLAPDRDRIVPVLELPLDCAMKRNTQRIRSDSLSEMQDAIPRKEGPFNSQASTLARMRSSTLHS